MRKGWISRRRIGRGVSIGLAWPSHIAIVFGRASSGIYEKFAPTPGGEFEFGSTVAAANAA
ncbi:MAG TPA: hypothetical protein VGF39_05655, partial [Stellaceae bacterium]